MTLSVPRSLFHASNGSDRVGVGRKLSSCTLLVVLASCSGGGGEGADGSEDPPTPAFSFATDDFLVRVGEVSSAVPGLTGTGGSVPAFTVSPPLPAGLQLDSASGTIQGVPVVAVPGADYVVSGTVAGEPLEDTLHIAVGEALPSEVAMLEEGFQVTRMIELDEATSKMAIAPDGRVFVNELMNGVITVYDPTSGPVQATDGTTFASLSVATGGHRGLLGIALSPQFETDSFVFAFATLAAGGGQAERGALLRWTDVGGVGQSETVLLDDLPVSAINNGGALCFDDSGMLLVSIGDTEDPLGAQSELSLAGKILRVDPSDGSVPADNPDPSSYIWATGLRNTFAMTLHPDSGTLFGADNGPTDDDELNLLLAGRNYEWGAAAGTSFGALAGPQLRIWPDVVVPTGLTFRDAADALDWPGDFDNSLYLALYDEEVIERFAMSGSQNTDIDSEHEFLRFTPFIDTNRPLDIVRGPEGNLWILTFTSVYCVERIR